MNHVLDELWQWCAWVGRNLCLLEGVWSSGKWVTASRKEGHKLWVWLALTLHWVVSSGHGWTWLLLLLLLWWEWVVAVTVTVTVTVSRVWWSTAAKRVGARVVCGSVSRVDRAGTGTRVVWVQERHLWWSWWWKHVSAVGVAWASLGSSSTRVGARTWSVGVATSRVLLCTGSTWSRLVGTHDILFGTDLVATTSYRVCAGAWCVRDAVARVLVGWSRAWWSTASGAWRWLLSSCTRVGTRAWKVWVLTGKLLLTVLLTRTRTRVVLLRQIGLRSTETVVLQ